MSLLKIIRWAFVIDGRKLSCLHKRGLIIGKGCEVLDGWNFGSEPYLVTIGNNVRVIAEVSITTHDGGVWVLRYLYPELSDVDKFERVAIGGNCHIGMGTTIMPGVVIGKNCVIDAGAIVTKDVPDDSVAVDVPA